MNPRLRRLLAACATLAFLAFWVWAAIALSTRLPANPLVQLLFYAVAGIGWGVPLFPLLKWAEKG